MTEPTDETQVDLPPPDETPANASGAGSTPAAAPPATMPLRADPDRPAASAWREPPWLPPRARSDRGPGLAAILVGLVLLVVGLYYLLDVTFGLDLPAVRWGSLWPVVLILLGGLIVLRAIGRR